jgi:hypothetical protein
MNGASACRKIIRRPWNAMKGPGKRVKKPHKSIATEEKENGKGKKTMTPENLKKYLRPTDVIDWNHPMVLEKAHSLSDGSQSIEEKVGNVMGSGLAIIHFEFHE